MQTRKYFQSMHDSFVSHACRSFPGKLVYKLCIGCAVKGIWGSLSEKTKPDHRSCFVFLVSSTLALQHGYKNVPAWPGIYILIVLDREDRLGLKVQYGDTGGFSSVSALPLHSL